MHWRQGVSGRAECEAHPSLDHPSEPRPLAGDPGVAAKDGAPTFDGGSGFQKLRVGQTALLL